MTDSHTSRPKTKTRSSDKKLFVVDTNVFLSDPMAVFGFKEHTVVITMTVLEELDRKKTCDRIGSEARACIDVISKIINGASHQEVIKGVPIVPLDGVRSDGNGFLRIYDDTKAVTERESSLDNIADNRIIAATIALEKESSDSIVILVTKDINMRLKALTLGARTQDYNNDRQLTDIDMLYSGCRNLLEMKGGDKLLKLIRGAERQPATNPPGLHPRASEYFSLNMSQMPEEVIPQLIQNASFYDPSSSKYSSIVAIDNATGIIEFITSDMDLLLKREAYGIKARSFEQAEALRALLDPAISLVILVGPAGSGKTLLALAAAIEQSSGKDRMALNNGKKQVQSYSKNTTGFDRIIVSRKLTDMTESIGFLPGTEEEKMAPWLGAIEDSLEIIAGTATRPGEGQSGIDRSDAQTTIEILTKSCNIQAKTLNFMRGRSLNNTFFLLDESQNMTPHQMRSMLTRMGEGSKIAVLGNLGQIDDKYISPLSSGLTWAVEHMKKFEGAVVVHLPGSERSPLAEFAEKAR